MHNNQIYSLMASGDGHRQTQTKFGVHIGQKLQPATKIETQTEKSFCRRQVSYSANSSAMQIKAHQMQV